MFQKKTNDAITPSKAPRAFFRRRTEQKNKSLTSVSVFDRTAKVLETHLFFRIWVRLNQSFPILAFSVALFGSILAWHKYNSDDNKANEDRLAKSWDVVTRMAGRKTNGGQVGAIEILVSNSISLDVIDLHYTYLAHVDLRGASLRGADLRRANLIGADLRGANLSGANLRGAYLSDSNLTGANLLDTDLSYANFYHARIDGSIVQARDLTEADLTGAKILYLDENGNDIWDAYWDTLGESSESDGANLRLKSACSTKNLNETQSKAFPFTFPIRTCKKLIDYSTFNWWADYGRPSELPNNPDQLRKYGGYK